MESNNARRIFVSISPKSPHFHAAWDSPNKIIETALGLVKGRGLVAYSRAPTPLFLAKERWHRIHIVFDIFNNRYMPDKAHLLGQNDLPVIEVYLSSGETARVADDAMRNKVNEEIRNIHDWTGVGSQPPFIIDHANGNVPVYENPRSLVRV